MKHFKLIPVIVCSLIIMLSCKKTQLNLDNGPYDFAYANYGDTRATIFTREDAHTKNRDGSINYTNSVVRADSSIDDYAFSPSSQLFICGTKIVPVGLSENSHLKYVKWFHYLDSLIGPATRKYANFQQQDHITWHGKTVSVVTDSTTGGNIILTFYPIKYKIIE